MPKVKVPRKNISLDMTAMCDMAFLLLTFFMLATKFKSSEAKVIDIPSSVSENMKSDKNILTISVDSKGTIYFDIDQPSVRINLLNQISDRYQLTLNNSEKKVFGNMNSFGVPVNQLKTILNMTQADREKYYQAGIPCDSMNNELKDWIQLAIKTNPDVEIAIKGDRVSDYEVMDKVIATLQDQNINKFNLVTNLEKNPN